MTIKKKKISSACLDQMRAISAARTSRRQSIARSRVSLSPAMHSYWRKITAARPRHRPTAILHPEVAALAEIAQNVSSNRAAQRSAEREFSVVIYAAALALSKDADARRDFYASDFWNGRPRKPAIGKDDNIAKHCARRALGFVDLKTNREVSELGKVLNSALASNLTRLEFEEKLSAGGSIRDLYRSNVAPHVTVDVRVSDKLRKVLRQSAASDRPFPVSQLRLERTSKGICITC